MINSLCTRNELSLSSIIHRINYQTIRSLSCRLLSFHNILFQGNIAYKSVQLPMIWYDIKWSPSRPVSPPASAFIWLQVAGLGHSTFICVQLSEYYTNLNNVKPVILYGMCFFKADGSPLCVVFKSNYVRLISIIEFSANEPHSWN